MIRAISLAAILVRLAAAASPTVTKVEPPDWPAEPTGNTLRLLVTGTNLASATVHSTFRANRQTITAGGTHLFVDLTIPPSAKPGGYPLKIADRTSHAYEQS